jgi:hypothetical protein
MVAPYSLIKSAIVTRGTICSNVKSVASDTIGQFPDVVNARGMILTLQRVSGSAGQRVSGLQQLNQL